MNAFEMMMVRLLALMTGGGGGTGNTGWSINNFLNNLNNQLFSWGAVIVVIIGVVMVIVAVFKIAKGLMSGGRGQTNWVLNIVLFFLGGALAFSGGWGLVQRISDGGASTLNDLGTALPMAISQLKMLF